MKMKIVLLGLILGLVAPAQAKDEPLSLDQLLAAMGWSFETAEIRTEKVGDGLYVLFGLGGNIAASVGEQGVLIVDDQFPEMIPQVEDAIRAVGGGPIDFAINTHWHFDHAEGNLALGPKGTWLVSHANSRAMMMNDHIINLVAMRYEQKAYPEDARPTIVFEDSMQFHFNGQQIDLIHAGPAHTTGDAAVIFRGTNAVHLGDVFNRGYPFIDVDNGGSLSGMISFCKAVLGEINEETVVIPGHGELSNYEGLKKYIAMLEDVKGKLSAMIASGKSLDEVIAARPTAPYDAEFGDPVESLGFLNRAYTSLSRAAKK